MWLPKRLPRRLLVLASIVTAVATLAGCGFQPVYNSGRTTGNGGAPATSALHHIVVAPIPDRAGVRLRNELTELFSPLQAPSTHTLRIALAISTQVVAIESDGSVRRQNQKYTATVHLIPAGSTDQRAEFATTVRANTGTEQLPSNFSSLVSENASEQRAIEQLAQRIRQQLAVHFARQG
ncbi:MAG: LPS assembly lipoprotein LptE [Alphaproteobacteria bacterium]|jgi:hypothetical protein